MISLVGTGALLRLALRRDRIRLPAWVAVLPLVAIVTASAFIELYPTPSSRLPFAMSIGRNAALRALVGTPFDLGSIGGLTAWRLGVLGAVLAALMSAFTVVRHTRAEEEAGRLELLGAGVVGRSAAPAAALIVAFGTNLLAALGVTAGLIALGLPAAGSLALGLALAGAGWLFAALAAVAAQIVDTARGARGIAGGVLGLSFLLRAAGDAAGEGGPSWLSWLSPIGWTQQIRPFAGERWGILVLATAVAVVFAVAALALAARRDVGASLFPPRLGPPEAAAGLRGPFALAWRLQRGALLAATLGCAVAGGVLGSMADGIADIARGNLQIGAILTMIGGAKGLVDAYFSAIMAIVGLVATAYAVQATLRLRAEETELRAEPILAASVGRTRWVLGHLAIAGLGPPMLLCVAGLAAGLAYGLRSGHIASVLPRLLGIALVQVPAAWVLAAIAAALFGLAPRLANATWGALVAFLLLAQLGPMLRLPRWAIDVSPFAHVPRLPGVDPTAAPIIGLCAVAAALTAAGLIGFRRRDVG